MWHPGGGRTPITATDPELVAVLEAMFDEQRLGDPRSPLERNKIERRLFSFISSNWHGEPLRDYETLVKLIASITTAKGLKVRCCLNRGKYPTGYRVTEEDVRQININIKRRPFHGEWNYIIRPKKLG